MKLNVNGTEHDVAVADEMPLLWVLRDVLGMRGTKPGCAMGQCGSCTVHVNGKATRSCVELVGTLAGKKVTTIEGLVAKGNHPVTEAWCALDVPQCGYCQPGQVMSAAALLEIHPDPTDAQIDEGMGGNLCRCGTYIRIKAAVKKASELKRGK